MVAGSRAAEPGKVKAGVEEVRVGELSPNTYRRKIRGRAAREFAAVGRNSREADFILIERKNFLIQCSQSFFHKTPAPWRVNTCD